MLEKQIMRFFTAILIGSMVASSTLAMASSSAETIKATTEKTTVALESNLEKIQKSLSGVVKKTPEGLILETDDGAYRLKGLSLDEIIGKEVHITGVVKQGKEESIIYVVKADVR